MNSLYFQFNKLLALFFLLLLIASAYFVQTATAANESEKPTEHNIVTSLKALPTRNEIIIGRENGAIELWTIKSAKLKWSTEPEVGSVISLWASEGKNLIKAINSWGDIKEIELNTGKVTVKGTLRGQFEDDFLKQASISPKGDYLIMPDNETTPEGTINKASGFDISNLADQGPRKVLSLYPSTELGLDTVLIASFCDHSKQVIMATRKGYILIWPDDIWKEVSQKDKYTASNPTGLSLDTAEHVRRIGRELLWKHFPVIRGGACSGSYVATVGVRSDAGNIQLWERAEMRLIDNFLPHEFDPHVLDPRHAYLDAKTRTLVTAGEIISWVWRFNNDKLTPIGRIARDKMNSPNSYRLLNETIDFLDDKIIFGSGSGAFILDNSTLQLVGQLGEGTPPNIKLK